MGTKDQREQLLAEYDALEDRIEDSAAGPIWDLADWLFVHVPNPGRGRRAANEPRSSFSLADLAERRGRSQQYLARLRRVAETTDHGRLPDVSVRTYQKALEDAGWDLDAANAAIQERGTRLRDHSAMESPAATRRQVQQLPPTERARIAAEVMEDPAVRKEVIQNMDSGTVVETGAEADEEHWQREQNKRAVRQEHQTELTVGGTGADEFREQLINESLDFPITSMWRGAKTAESRKRKNGARFLDAEDALKTLKEIGVIVAELMGDAEAALETQQQQEA